MHSYIYIYTYVQSCIQAGRSPGHHTGHYGIQAYGHIYNTHTHAGSQANIHHVIQSATHQTYTHVPRRAHQHTTRAMHTPMQTDTHIHTYGIHTYIHAGRQANTHAEIHTYRSTNT